MKRFQIEMSLQFAVEDLSSTLVSLSYLSSEEDMEVDDPPAVTEVENSDSDIEVLACYRKVPTSRTMAIAGRCMTTEISDGGDDPSLLEGYMALRRRKTQNFPLI